MSDRVMIQDNEGRAYSVPLEAFYVEYQAQGFRILSYEDKTPFKASDDEAKEAREAVKAEAVEAMPAKAEPPKKAATAGAKKK